MTASLSALPARPRSGRAAGLLLAFVLALFFAPVATAQAQNGDTPAGETKTTIAVENDQTTDTAIERRIDKIFIEIKALQRVRVDVVAGVVHLTGTVLDAEAIDEAAALAARVEGVVTVKNDIVQVTSLRERLMPAWERFVARMKQVIALGPLLAVALIAFALMVLAGFAIARLSWPWDRIAPNGFVAGLYRQIVRIAFAAGGLVVALDILGATALLGTMLGAAGIAGLAVGFAVRDTVENYIASIMLSIRQPFRPNDHVQIDSFEGYVIRLTSRATILLTFDGNHVRIPNATVFKGVITNYTLNPDRRFTFKLGVDPDCNLRDALDLVIDTLKAFDFTLSDPEPNGWIEDLGDSNVVMTFTCWVNQRNTSYVKARSEAIRLSKRALESAGFSLPEPIYRLRFDGDALGLASVTEHTPRKAPEPKPTGTPEELAEDAASTDASAEDDVVEKVEEERARSDQQTDLLDTHAPRE